MNDKVPEVVSVLFAHYKKHVKLLRDLASLGFRSEKSITYLHDLDNEIHSFGYYVKVNLVTGILSLKKSCI